MPVPTNVPEAITAVTHANDYIGYGGAGLAVTVFLLWFRKTLSNLGVSVGRDSAEVNILKTLQEQIKDMQDRLDKAEAENHKMGEELAQVKAELGVHRGYKDLAEQLQIKLDEKSEKYEKLLEQINGKK